MALRNEIEATHCERVAHRTSCLATVALVLVLGCTEHARPSSPPSPSAATRDDAATASDAGTLRPDPCESLFAEYDAEAKAAMLAACTTNAECACMQAVSAHYGSPYNCAAAFHGAGIARSHLPTLRGLETQLGGCAIERCPAIPCEPRCVAGHCENAKQLPGP